MAKKITDYECDDSCLPLFLRCSPPSLTSIKTKPRYECSSIGNLTRKDNTKHTDLRFDMALVPDMRTPLVKRGQYVPNNAWSSDTCSFQIEHSAALQLNFKLQHFPVRQLAGPDRSGNLLFILLSTFGLSRQNSRWTKCAGRQHPTRFCS